MTAVENLLGGRKPSLHETQMVAIDKIIRDSPKTTAVKIWPKLTRAAMNQIKTPNLVSIMGHKDHYKDTFLEFLSVLKATTDMTTSVIPSTS